MDQGRNMDTEWGSVDIEWGSADEWTWHGLVQNNGYGRIGQCGRLDIEQGSVEEWTRNGAEWKGRH